MIKLSKFVGGALLVAGLAGACQKNVDTNIINNTEGDLGFKANGYINTKNELDNSEVWIRPEDKNRTYFIVDNDNDRTVSEGDEIVTLDWKKGARRISKRDYERALKRSSVEQIDGTNPSTSENGKTTLSRSSVADVKRKEEIEKYALSLAYRCGI